ncbi:tripartite tricarboxylate transporter permease [Chelatococcus asaccharovorans]|uniref:tripartite tricarboxylate transporter permease n=1 Tax=Chelatococcus asaccharovorans TaxID=28210 RepID=UPI000D76656D|nr:tripartite tricarboxylate transporter permease [Chelatococcus asaccharovorans]MBS7708135.1 tripartite tricarboxylate transporter permease [Chelatococcus asaccharovorans]
MDLFDNLQIGFAHVVTPINLLYCFIGVFLGTLIGVLPGLGPAATIAILLPMTFTLDPTTSLIMLAGIYYGAQYGGSTTAILVNLPGESSSVVTALDGYQMARQGRAGLALATAALASFFAGTVAALVIALAGPLMAAVALSFGAADYFALMVLGLTASVALAQGSLVKALGMVTFGLIVGLVGVDVTSGSSRMTFGLPDLLDGISIVAVAMGLFGLGEIMLNLTDGEEARSRQKEPVRITLPNRQEMKQISGPVVRGTVIGSVLGILPGGGALLSSFTAYAVEKKISKEPSRFGRGAIEGVAAPEAANNAGAQTSLIPLLTLGLPSNVIAALMAGALIIQGIQPGPQIISSQPALFWGLVASMWIGNLMLVLLNLPMIGLWVRLLRMPYKFLFPAILVFCSVGVFSLQFSSFSIWVMVVFGALGYLLRRLDCEPAPFLLGMILGPMMEEYFRRAMLLSRGDPMVFLERPISATLLVLAALAMISISIPALRARRDAALKE